MRILITVDLPETPDNRSGSLDEWAHKISTYMWGPDGEGIKVQTECSEHREVKILPGSVDFEALTHFWNTK